MGTPRCHRQRCYVLHDSMRYGYMLYSNKHGAISLAMRGMGAWRCWDGASVPAWAQPGLGSDAMGRLRAGGGAWVHGGCGLTAGGWRGSVRVTWMWLAAGISFLRFSELLTRARARLELRSGGIHVNFV